MLGCPGHTANQFNQSVRLRTSLFNQVIYLNHKPQCSTFWIIFMFILPGIASQSVEITDPWGDHSGTPRGHGLPLLGAAAIVDPLGMTCDIDFVSEASLSCLTAEVVLNIYHILNYVYIYKWFVLICVYPPLQTPAIPSLKFGIKILLPRKNTIPHLSKD